MQPGPYGQQPQHPGYPQHGAAGYPPAPPGYPPPGYQQPGFQQPGYPPPGYQQPGYRQPAYPAPPQPAYRAPAPKRKSTVGSLIFMLLLCGGIGGGIAWFIANDDSARSASVGDCLKNDGTQFKVVECNAQDAAYKAVSKLDGFDSCPDLSYESFRKSATRRSASRYTLCMGLNAAEGDCFKQSGGQVGKGASKVACGAGATYKVTKVISGKADATACGKGMSTSSTDPTKPAAVVYSEPPLTLCTAPASA